MRHVCREYREKFTEVAETAGYKVVLHDTDRIPGYKDNEPMIAYSCDGFMILEVAMDNPDHLLFGTMAHEQGHVEQKAEGKFRGFYVPSLNLTREDVLDYWVKGSDNYEFPYVKECCDFTRDMELDANRRGLRIVIVNDLPVNIERYIAEAAAHVHGYNYKLKRRTQVWKEDKPAYLSRIVTATMPTTLRGNFARPTHEQVAAFDRFMRGK